MLHRQRNDEQPVWVEVPAEAGAFTVNVGDFLQLLSNDRFRSAEHRVVLKNATPRVSLACFFSTHFHPASTRMYGNPPLFRETLVTDYIKHYYSIGLDAETAISEFRL